jgi:hypothetical protein
MSAQKLWTLIHPMPAGCAILGVVPLRQATVRTAQEPGLKKAVKLVTLPDRRDVERAMALLGGVAVKRATFLFDRLQRDAKASWSCWTNRLQHVRASTGVGQNDFYGSDRVQELVSKWCPSEASVGQIWGTSVTLCITSLLSDIKWLYLFP